MCKLKPHMVEQPKPVRSSHLKSHSRSTDIGGGSSLFPKASTSTANSLASLRDSLPENPNLYRYKELADATAQFASGRMGKSSVWKCILRGKTVAVTMRKQKRKIGDFRSGLREICNAHHASIVKLLGGCCEGGIVYLVYEYVKGSSLVDCLRGSKAPGFTVLSTWISWIDPRLKDSFPVDCAEWVARIASSCVDPEPGNRTDTRYVAGELSKVFIMSEQWSEQMEANKSWVSGTFEAR